jgi:hypothetical protein
LAPGLRHIAAVLHLALGLGLGCTQAPEHPATQGEVKSEPAPVPPRAVLAGLTGEVAVKRAAGDTWIGATESMALFENDKVRTSAGARAQIRFASGSALEVGEDALLGIAETRTTPGRESTDVTVLKGRIEAELSDPSVQSLSVGTPAATVRAGREIVFQ